MTDHLFEPGSLHLVAGGAGFIGSHLCDLLLSKGLRVLAVDDLSLGKPGNVAHLAANPQYAFVQADTSTESGWKLVADHLKDDKPTVIWHLAANSDISAGVADAQVDLRRTFMTTHATVEAAKRLGVRALAFASTSAVYGELNVILDETSGPLQPVSNYGAMKLASEAILSAATSSILDHVWVFRFPNVIGSRSTHGVIHDFFHKLLKTPGQLDVLGNGTQCKPYLHVQELVDALWHITTHSSGKVNCYMIGPEGAGTTVREIAEMVVAEAGGNAAIVYGTGDRGWVGDVPKFEYSTAKLQKLGWQPTLGSTDAVRRAVREIHAEILGK